MSHDAADWFALKRSGEMDAQQLLGFQAWLEAAPENRAAFEEAEETWAMAGLLRDDPELMLLRAEARTSHPPFRRAMAAALAGLVLGAGVLGWLALEPGGQGAQSGAARQQQAFRTGVGQRTTVTLADGSVVTLDTDTILRTRESVGERRMYLDRGRAFFRVAKDPTRPFVVEAAGRTVTALGTVFDVRVERGQFEVTLVEGKVRVEAKPRLFGPEQKAELRPGYHIAARDDREWTVTPADVPKETGWVEGRLTFVDDPLSEVAAEMNRYSERKIVLRDPEVGAVPVVAVFRPGDLESFVRMVRGYRLAQVTETPDKVELSALTPP